MARGANAGRLAVPERRVDVRVLIGFLVFFGVIAGGLLFWQSQDETTPVLALARDVAPGEVLQAEDVSVVRLKLPPELATAVVPAAEGGQVVGRVASEPLHAGTLLSLEGLKGRPEVPPTGGVMAIPVKPESAVGGRIRVGDRVRVIATGPQGSDSARTETVLAEALVYDVGLSAPLGPLAATTSDRGNGSIAYVSLVVNSPEEMERLAWAKEKAAVDLVWLPPRGTPGTRPELPATSPGPASDPAVNQPGPGVSP